MSDYTSQMPGLMNMLGQMRRPSPGLMQSQQQAEVDPYFKMLQMGQEAEGPPPVPPAQAPDLMTPTPPAADPAVIRMMMQLMGFGNQ